MAKKHKAPPFKIPRSQMSKFDPKRRPDMLTIGIDSGPFKAEAVTNQVHDAVQGCGNPFCDICMPKNGKPGDARFGGNPGGSSDDYVRSSIERMARSFMGSGITFEIMSSGSDRSSGESVAYRQAKEKVEKYILATAHDLQWDDVVGNEAARTALVEAIEAPVKHAELYRHYGQKPLKGVMLHGPPGCGKTMFGKAAASVIGRLHGQKALLIRINGPEIQSPYVGVTEQIIRDIFAFARIYAKEKGHPLTIFIDEADAILPSRSGRIAGFEMSNVATFLAEMDGLEGSGAFVILATNRPEAIDAALLRDGRCDRKIKVERPRREAAHAILRKGLGAAPVAGDLDDLVSGALQHFYSTDHILGSFRIGRGKEAEDHAFHLHRIVNGAMLVGLVERAKAIAFRRDLAAGAPSGIGLDDMKAAIGAVLEENRGMDHSYAMQEFLGELAERIGETVH